ncbi:MAG: DNA gyrase subunit A [Rhodospirillales bacterium]|nr:DNA gyrase subunit A [Rhodospirillales bacterium]MSP80689.1 DNA gyrase subunit A [Rhodospirillales bacterium]
MRRSYLDYAMSVIVARALPDVRDGLKPVHRRILYSMQESGYDHNKPFRKSARIVGDVMGKYHPHGDSAIYDAMVRMAQDFSMRLPLIDGQGNFGSMDGDGAAAMRYTEARLALSAHALLEDIERETVDFQPNYDESTREPVVLPAGYPNLLVNGAGGIAVGMATNIPPHNLGEIIDACCACMDNPEVTVDDLIRDHVPGPDFPTGGTVLGRGGILSAYRTGRGSIIMRGKTSIEDIRKDRPAIIVHEVPYQVNKARMIEIMAEAVRDKRIEGIADLRDESDRDGVRVVIELKRDAEPKVVLNQLYRYTPLESSFGIIMLALDGGRPRLMNLKEIIEAFIAFREEVVRRRTVFELGRARDKAHILAGLAVAVANIDEVIKLIRAAKDPQIAKEKLMARAWPATEVAAMIALLDEPGHRVEDGKYTLSETQAKAILDLRLHRLTGLERDKIGADLKELGIQIERYLAILASRSELYALLRQELLAMKAKFANPRRTVFEEGEADAETEESLIQREEMVATVTNTGYIKRVPLSTYRAQRRGGKGRTGMATKEEDFVSQVFVASTHTPLLFFSSTGIAYKLKVYKLPIGTPTSRGKALVNLLPLKEGETITTIMPLPEDETTWDSLFVMFATRSGDVRRNRLSDFATVWASGKIAMKLAPGDALVRVSTCTDAEDIFLCTRVGKCIRFSVGDIRVFAGRTSTGVRGIKLADDDHVISMSLLRHVEFGTEERDAYLRLAVQRRRAEGVEEAAGENGDGAPAPVKLGEARAAELATVEEFILSVTENGFGKRSSAYEYRLANRGGQGIANIDVSARNGAVVASFPVKDGDQIMMVTDGGQLIRIPVGDIRIAGRSTQGVTLFKTAEGERVVSVTRLSEPEETGKNDNGGDLPAAASESSRQHLEGGGESIVRPPIGRTADEPEAKG